MRPAISASVVTASVVAGLVANFLPPIAWVRPSLDFFVARELDITIDVASFGVSFGYFMLISISTAIAICWWQRTADPRANDN